LTVPPNSLEAKAQAQMFIEEYREVYPALVKCVEKDLDASIVYMNHPPNRSQADKAACKGHGTIP